MSNDDHCQASRHDHCWHITDRQLESAPPQRVRFCCHCGTLQSSWLSPRKVHGPFYTPDGRPPHLN